MNQYPKKGWNEYYNLTRSKPPRPLFLNALSYVTTGKKALDIGAGTLNETKYLLERGFDVTAIDADPLLETEAQSISSDRFQHLVTRYDAFPFPTSEYDFVYAMYALPFNPMETYNDVISRAKTSLKSGGILAAHFFGPKDEWNVPGSPLSFHRKSDIENLFADMEIVSLTEEENDKGTTEGAPKHWHVFHLIARKK